MDMMNKTLRFDYEAGKFYVDAPKSYIESGSRLLGNGTYSYDMQTAALTMNSVKWTTSAEIALDLTDNNAKVLCPNICALNSCEFRSRSIASSACGIYFEGTSLTISTSIYGKLWAEARSYDDKILTRVYAIKTTGHVNIKGGNVIAIAEGGLEYYGILASGDINIYNAAVTSKAYGWPVDVPSYGILSESRKVVIDYSEVEAVGRISAVYGNIYLGPLSAGFYKWWSLEGFAPPWDENAEHYGAVEGSPAEPGDFEDVSDKTYLQFLPARTETADTWPETDDSLYLYHKHTMGSGAPIIIMPVHFSKADLMKSGKYQAASTWAADLVLGSKAFEGIADCFDIYIYLKGDLICPVPQSGYESSFHDCYIKMKSLVVQTLGDSQVHKARMIYLGNSDHAGQVGGHSYRGIGAMLSWGINPKTNEPWENDPKYWLLHEFAGHAFGNLGDEYKRTPSWDPAPHLEAPNLYVSPTKPDKTDVPWNAFIGFKEGDHEPADIYGYDDYNAWRPSYSSFMNGLSDYFIPMYHKWVIYEKLMEYAETPKTLEDFCRFEGITLTPFSVAYSAHVKAEGWLDYVRDGQTAGTTGESRRMEAVKIRLENCTIPGARITYRVHAAYIGWMPYVYDDQIAGTTGEARRIEAVQINLVGMSQYSVEYCVHMQGTGWSPWVKDGAVAGTTGESRRIEAIQIRIRKK